MSSTPAPSDPKHLVLVGMMGVGKTTTGIALAERLGWPLRDCDLDLEERTGRTGADLVVAHGIAHLHQLEERILLETLALEGPVVVTAAGSVVNSEEARTMLAERAVVVWLDAPVDELVQRMAMDTHRRPLDRDAAAHLLEERRDHLDALADLRLDARSPTDELVERIVDVLGLTGHR